MQITNKKTAETHQMDGISEIQDWRETIYCDIQRLIPDFKDGVDKLGVVLEEMVKMLDLDGSGIDVFLIQYVADARHTLRALLQNLEMEASPKTPENMHKS